MYTLKKEALIAINADKRLNLLPGMANRHGLITGATGTGKTVTLQTFAETFSEMGVPVFAADVKGDLSGVAAEGGNKESIRKRVENYKLGKDGFAFRKFPVQFWDVFGEQGTPIQATISQMGPLLFSRLLNLNDTQSSLLTVVFKICEDSSWELVELKDLTKVIEYIGMHRDRFMAAYGNIPTTSLGAIQRGLVALEHDGGNLFFREPYLNFEDFMQVSEGKGVINILAADKLMGSPRLYTTFLLWMLTRIFDVLPEVGDPEKPRFVFFFDEAHLLFSDAPKALVDTIERVVRLIRSKGVGVYFISQTPSDMPDSVLSQLGNRVQHALRAYTPKDQKTLKAAAESFRANPGFDTRKAISELGTGEALVSFLDEKGAPHPVERAFILPPQGQVGPLDESARKSIVRVSLLNQYYSKVVERETAFDVLEGQLSEIRQTKENAQNEKITQAEQRARKAYEKEQKREAAEKRKFWSGMMRSMMPLVRDVITSIIKPPKTPGGRK